MDRRAFSMIWIGFQVTCTTDLEVQLVNLGFISSFFLSLSVSYATCPLSCSSTAAHPHGPQASATLPLDFVRSPGAVSALTFQLPCQECRDLGVHSRLRVGGGPREAQERQFGQLLCLTMLIHQPNRCNCSTLRGWLGHQGHPQSLQAIESSILKFGR